MYLKRRAPVYGARRVSQNRLGPARPALARLDLARLGPPPSNHLQPPNPTHPKQVPNRSHPPSVLFVDSSAKSALLLKTTEAHNSNYGSGAVWGRLGPSGVVLGPSGAISARLGLAKLGSPRLGSAWLGSVRSGPVWLGSARPPWRLVIVLYFYGGVSQLFRALTHIYIYLGITGWMYPVLTNKAV